MASDSILFHKIDSESDLVAVAEVPLFRGVYLRGWYVYQRGGKIEVLPPHKVYHDPSSREERTWSLLRFESLETERRWLDKVAEEYRRWAKGNNAIQMDPHQLSEDKG
jgi:hypothetical protein